MKQKGSIRVRNTERAKKGDNEGESTGEKVER